MRTAGILLIMVNITSFNVNGLRNFEKRKKIYYHLKEIQQTEILFLQETHCTPKDEKLWHSQWGGGQVYHSFGENNARGVAIMFKKNIPIKLLNCLADDKGRYLILEVELLGLEIILATLYAPNKDSPEFFLEFFKQIETLTNKNVLLAGDFNLVINSTKDRAGTSEYNQPRSLQIVQRYMEKLELVDIWRARNENKTQYSWHRNGTNQYSRIDFFLVASSLAPKVTKSNISASVYSDHSIVNLGLNPVNIARGKGFWKFNAQLLNDSVHNQKVENAARAALHQFQDENPALQWEMIKMYMVRESIDHARFKATQQNEQLKQWQDRLDWLRVQLEISPEGEQDELEIIIANIKKDIDTMLKEKHKGSVFRSKCQFFAEGERSSKYYFNLEKSRYNKKVITQLFSEQGNLETDPRKILKIQADFFEKLYTKDEIVNFDLINNSTKIITHNEAQTCDKPITMQEMTQALNDLNSDKTPGSDGLTVEFYKHFWTVLSTPLLNAILYAKQKGILHVSARRGVLSLIPKKDRDIRFIENQRPITLLNTDYKILAKSIANRMKNALEQIISPHQTGFMPGRQISHNIRKILDIIEYTNQANLPGVILSLDFYKCFDTLDHTSIQRALSFYGFGDEFIEYVSLLYKDMITCVQNNGSISRWFKNGRGSPQGSPASTVIYLICGQIMSDLLENNDEIQGLEILGHKELLVQFADDTNLFLPFQQNILNEVMRTLTKIHVQIGLQVNYDKTLLYRIGSLKHSNARLYTTKGIAWTNDPIKVLGVLISQENVTELNYANFITEDENTLKCWKNRNPSLMGRVLLVNSLVGSRYVYKMTVLPSLDDSYIKKFHTMIRKFLWNDSKPKIALSTLQNDKTEGGLRLVNLFKKDLALKFQWVKVLQTDGFFARIFYNQLKIKVGEAIWNGRLTTRDAKALCQSAFWSDVLVAWNVYKTIEINTIQEIANQSLWFNSKIKIENSVTYKHRAWQAGLKVVADLYDGKLLMTYNQLCRKFGNVLTWYEHIQLVDAIPTIWKQQMGLQSHIRIGVSITNINLSANVIYSTLIKEKTAISTYCLKWERLLDIQLEKEDYYTLISNTYKLTMATKYRNFQYRLFHHAIVTNKHLKLWQIRDNYRCSFCDNFIENYAHLFFQCSVIRPIWNDLEEWLIQLNYTSGNFVEIEINVKNVLFNTLTKKRNHITNFIALIVKQFIYSCRCIKRMPTSNAVFQEIQNIYEIEHSLAKKQNKWNLHVTKWKFVKPNLQYEQVTDFAQVYLAQL